MHIIYNIVDMSFILRIINAILGYLFIIISIEDKNMYYYVMLVPLSILASLLVDFGRTELSSKYGLSHSQIKASLYEWKFIALVSIIVIIISNYLNFEEKKIIAASVIFSGIIQVPIDCLLRSMMYNQKSPMLLYLYQFSLALSNIVTLLLYRFHIINLTSLLVVICIASGVMIEIFVFFNIFRFKELEVKFIEFKKSIRLIILSLIYKTLPMFIYTVGLYISEIFQSKALAFQNRTMFFAFGFCQVRVISRQNFDQSKTKLFFMLILAATILAGPLIIYDKLKNNQTLIINDFIDDLFLFIIISVLVAFGYAFVLALYREFIKNAAL